jgi:hypothetical protein
MVKIEFFSERYKDLAHPLTETLGACRRGLWVPERCPIGLKGREGGLKVGKKVRV